MNELSAEEKILRDCHTVALVGASPDAERQLQGVLLPERTGVPRHTGEPAISQILGEPCYPELAAIPEKVDVVDIFRGRDVPPVVDQAIGIGAKVVDASEAWSTKPRQPGQGSRLRITR